MWKGGGGASQAEGEVQEMCGRKDSQRDLGASRRRLGVRAEGRWGEANRKTLECCEQATCT